VPDEKVDCLKDIESRQMQQYNRITGVIPRNYIYKGEVHKKTNLPHGRGIMLMDNGDIYEGFFREGCP
jgi:hypothetical protein